MAGSPVGREAFGRSPGSGGGTAGSKVSVTGGSAMAGSPADGLATGASTGASTGEPDGAATGEPDGAATGEPDGAADAAAGRTGPEADAADHGDDDRIGTGPAGRGGPGRPSFFGEVNEGAIGWLEPYRDGDAGPAPVVRDAGSDTGDGVVAAARP